MRIRTRRNIIKGLTELVIVIVGVTIAFGVEQYRQNVNSNQKLEKSLVDIEKSLQEDSITITSFSYDEISSIISKIDSAIIDLSQGKSLDLRQQQNIFTQPLMDFSNSNLDVFIRSETFNYYENANLKMEMIFYKQFTNDIWEKEKRLLDYLQNSITPSVFKICNVYTDKAKLEKSLLNNKELIKVLNDLQMLNQEYNDRLHRLWPGIVESNSSLRLAIRTELKKGI